jgi:hypothetical protein
LPLLTALVFQAPGTIVLSEIMYNPDGNTLGLDEHLEWIEICSPATEAVNLSGFMLSDGNNQVYLGRYLLSPGSYEVVPANGISLKTAYGNDVRKPAVQRMPGMIREIVIGLLQRTAL